jgi:hypothetical protein
MRFGWQFDLNLIASLHDTIRKNHTHDPGLANQIAIGIVIQNRSHQAGLEAVKLQAGIAQSGDLEDGLTDLQFCSDRQREQIQTTGGDVLAHLARSDLKASSVKLIVQFAVNQMHLSQVRLGRIGGNPRAMLDRHARVRVTFNAQTGKQAN